MKNLKNSSKLFILIVFLLQFSSVKSQFDTLHIYYLGSNTKTLDSNDAKIANWAKTLPAQKTDIKIFAYYTESANKEAAKQRTEEIFLVVNRKARDKVNIISYTPEKGKKYQRSVVDIIYQSGKTSTANTEVIQNKQESKTDIPTTTATTTPKETVNNTNDNKDSNKEEINTKEENNNKEVAKTETVKENSSSPKDKSEASDGNGRRNVSKINLLPGPIFLIFGLAHEVGFAKRFSVQTSITFMPGRKIKSIPTGVSFEEEEFNPFTSAKLSYFGNVTEFRIYPKNKGGLNGFYFGPYFSYGKYKFATNTYPAKFSDENNVVYQADVKLAMSFATVGGGLQIGYQWLLLNKRLVIDWTFLGLGYGSGKFSGGMEATNTSNNFDFNNYKNEVESATLGLESVPFFKVTKEVKPNSVNFSAKIPFVIPRGNLSVGFAF
jgi:hypothetical protein